ncbi:MAG TPA: redoxin family protein [Puia sp.]|nr:redoxin family protein [Puia sp.]
MKKRFLARFALLMMLLPAYTISKSEDHKTLAIGSPAPDFTLPGVDGKTYSLSSFKHARILVIVFTCNHCPTAQAYEDRLISLTADYAGKNVSVVAVNPNDPKSLRLDELDFSDLGDSFEEMKERAGEKKFNFPYLYDGETETMSKAYGPVATPHVFVFDQDRHLRYTGRVDDMESPFKTPRSQDTRNAIDALLNTQEVPVKTTKVFGCSVKWAEKRNLVQQSLEKWAKEPVSLSMIDAAGLKDLLKNSSDKLRLIHVWASSNEPSVREFPEFVIMNRMYRDRDFEFISISTDDPATQEKVLQVLKKQQASNTNFLFNESGQRKFADAVDPAWKGDLPYVLLIEPGGKIVYAKQGVIDPAMMKKIIVGNHLIGRYP